jgi:hypothetical protein
MQRLTIHDGDGSCYGYLIADFVPVEWIRYLGQQTPNRLL